MVIACFNGFQRRRTVTATIPCFEDADPETATLTRAQNNHRRDEDAPFQDSTDSYGRKLVGGFSKCLARRAWLPQPMQLSIA